MFLERYEWTINPCTAEKSLHNQLQDIDPHEPLLSAVVGGHEDLCLLLTPICIHVSLTAVASGR